MNNQQKGFSLIEVLVSLLLVSTVALALLQQQWQTKQLLNQLVLRTGASQYLDKIEEALCARLHKVPNLPSPYHFSVKESKSNSVLNIEWFKFGGAITRTQYQVGSLR